MLKMGVEECPDPTGRTVCPWRRAFLMSLKISRTEVGEAHWEGLNVMLPDQFVKFFVIGTPGSGLHFLCPNNRGQLDATLI